MPGATNGKKKHIVPRKAAIIGARGALSGEYAKIQAIWWAKMKVTHPEPEADGGAERGPEPVGHAEIPELPRAVRRAGHRDHRHPYRHYRDDREEHDPPSRRVHGDRVRAGRRPRASS